MRTLAFFTGVAVFALFSSALAVCTVSAPRSQTFDAEDIETVRLEAQRDGTTLVVTALPEAGFLQSARLDVDVRLPERMRVEIDDRSGDVSVVGVADVRLSDRSGDVSVEGILTNVRVDRDRSGDLSVMDVGGDVTVAEDASGNIEIRQVQGSVAILDDGSGDITVDAVGGDLTVDDAGSGAVRHSSVEGNVHIPRDGTTGRLVRGASGW